jgi:hypothetical protein
MKKSKTNPKVDWYFNKPHKWQEEIKVLRDVILSSGLNEELKCRVIVIPGIFEESACAVLKVFSRKGIKSSGGTIKPHVSPETSNAT